MKKILSILLIVVTIGFWYPNKVSAAAPTDYVSCWDMEEQSSTRFDANTTNTNDLGDGNSVGTTTGKVGSYAANFTNTSNHYLYIDDIAQVGLDFSTTFTIAAWVNLKSSVNSGIFTKDDTSAAAKRSYALWISGGNLQALVASGGGQFDFYETLSTPIAVTNGTTWYHVVLTANTGNPSATTFEFFVNGTSRGNGNAILSDNLATINNGTGQVQLGDRVDSALSMNGYMDVVEVYDRVLTGTEITNLYNSGSGVACTGRAAGAAPAPHQNIIFFD